MSGNPLIELKLERIRRGILQREVAARIGMSPAMLSDFENGWRKPTAQQLEQILEAIGITPEELAHTEAVRR